jgi:hypothetical protein
MSPEFPKAEPHGSIEEIFADTYFVTGSVSFKPLVRLTRNMIILRNGEELTLINTVRLNEAGEAALDALGTVEHIVKIGFHGMDDDYYVERHKAKRWAVPGAEGSSAPEPDVVLSEATELPVPGARVFMFRDTVLPEAAILLEREGGLLITCDSVQHWAPHDLMSPAARLLTRLMGFQHPAQIGPPWSKRQTPPSGSLRDDFERLASLPFKHMIGGHGGLLRDEGQARFKETIQRVYSG